jgi:hypothetical protein
MEISFDVYQYYFIHSNIFCVSLQDRRNTVGDIRKNTGKTGPDQVSSLKGTKKIENISYKRAHAHFYNITYILNFRGLNA